jgi:hypothetical protein
MTSTTSTPLPVTGDRDGDRAPTGCRPSTDRRRTLAAMDEQWRVHIDAEVTFANGGSLRVERPRTRWPQRPGAGQRVRRR